MGHVEFRCLCDFLVKAVEEVVEYICLGLRGKDWIRDTDLRELLVCE